MFDYSTLWQTKFSLGCYAFLALAIISLWVNRHILIWGSLLAIGVIWGLIAHRLAPIALVTVFTLGLSFFLAFQAKSKTLKTFFSFFAPIFSIGPYFFLMPGFRNFEIAHALKLTPDAIPYSPYFNFDKPLIGLMILGLGFSYVNYKKFTFKTIQQTFIVALLALITLPILSLFIHYVKFDPKWPPIFYIWVVHNLIFVCVTEEALFRGFIQRKLERAFSSRYYGKALSILIASLLFGLSHYRGGWTYVALSSIAGLFYGAAYARTGRIESSILCHFLVNTLHILFFSYPALS